MEIIITNTDEGRVPFNVTARTAAAMIMEGYEVLATSKAWGRINKRGYATYGVPFAHASLNEVILLDTQGLLLNMDVADVIHSEGGVEELWEELEILGLVPEWDQVDEEWMED